MVGWQAVQDSFIIVEAFPIGTQEMVFVCIGKTVGIKAV